MIPILYERTATTFTANGLGRLPDSTECIVHEVLNGEYTASLTYPVDGLHAEDIQYGRILYMKPNQDGDNQPFRIVKIQESLDKKNYVITANHISYDLTGIPVRPFTATGAENALNGLVTNAMTICPFTVETDSTNTTTSFKVDVPKSFRACLGGQEGSIIDQFAGELEFDKFNVIHHAHRGSNKGASIRYGKNMESFVNVRSIESVYSGVLSYWKNNDTTIVGNVVNADTASSFPSPKIYFNDVTSDFQNAPTVAQLDAKSNSYISANNIGRLYIDTVTVAFIPIWQTEEYKDLKEFETVSLGDSVLVVYGGFNFTVKAVEYSYDVLRERYKSMTLGSKRTTLLETIKKVV